MSSLGCFQKKHSMDIDLDTSWTQLGHDCMKIINQLNNIDKDKWEHYAVALTITCLLRVLLPWWVAGLIVLAVSIVKEIYDKVSGKGTPDWYDLLADVIGISVGLI